MSYLLFVAGAVAVMVGVGMIGFGIPINEFSFGNTLIISGTVAAIGGLVVGAIGVAVAELQKMSEGLGTRTPARSGRPLDTFEPAARPAPATGRIPLAAKHLADAPLREPHPLDPRMAAAEQANLMDDDRTGAPPALRNPDIPAAEGYEDVSPLPGRAGHGEHARSAPPSNANGSGMPEKQRRAAAGEVWGAPPPPRSPQLPPPNYFDNMWPAEPKPAKTPTSPEMRLELRPDLPPQPAAAPEAFKQRPAAEPRGGVAILKSGVVDGMAYTLYVDGSIEAELPQGTLRFASINDLRNHLSKSA